MTEPLVGEDISNDDDESVDVGGETAATGPDGFGYARLIAYVGFAVQFVILSLRSWHKYTTFSVTGDFAIFYNAWTQIAHGTLNPFNDALGYHYIDSHFELIMWPLALIGLITKSGYALLEIQNIGYAGSGLVAFLWACDICKSRQASTGSKRLIVSIALVVVSVMVANPWVYLGAGFDFHLQALATLLALLAGRSFYLEQDKRAFVFLALTLMSGDVGCTYIVAIAVSLFFLKPKRRWTAYVCLATSVAWLGLVSVVGANNGSFLNRYTWLLGPNARPSKDAPLLLLAATAILTHPLRVAQAFWDRADGIFDKLSPTGFVGILTPFTLPLSLLLLFENTLNSEQLYWTPTFQDTPLVVLSGAGLVTIAYRLGTSSNRWRLLAYPALLAVSVNALWFDTHRPLPLNRYEVSTAEASTLSKVYSQLHYNDQVVVSYSVVGRFAGRAHYSILNQLPMKVPVNSGRIIFVMDLRENDRPNLLHRGLPAAAEYLRNTLHATQIAETDEVSVLAWQPPLGTRTVTLPAPTK